MLLERCDKGKWVRGRAALSPAIERPLISQARQVKLLADGDCCPGLFAAAPADCCSGLFDKVPDDCCPGLVAAAPAGTVFAAGAVKPRSASADVIASFKGTPSASNRLLSCS